MELRGEDFDYSTEATDRIAIDYPAGRDMTLGVKADSIIDELSRIIEPRVTMHFTDPSRAVTFETTYDEIMECLSITQTEVMKMADKLSLYNKERTNLEQFVIFFDMVQCLMINLKPLARIAEQETEDGE